MADTRVTNSKDFERWWESEAKDIWEMYIPVSERHLVKELAMRAWEAGLKSYFN